MPLTFQPRPGAVVMCDFTGNIVPEMIKIRPVVVVARNRKNRHLVTVVPLSTTPPDTLERHHHTLSINPLPAKVHQTCWAKCDMLATVSLTRLDRIKVARSQYIVPTLAQSDFQAVRSAIMSALDLTAPGAS